MLQSYSQKGMQALFCGAMILSAILLFGCSGGSSGIYRASRTRRAARPAGAARGANHYRRILRSLSYGRQNRRYRCGPPQPHRTGRHHIKYYPDNTGGFAVVTFHAATTAGPVTNLTFADARFFIADLVPANTGTGYGTWPTAYFERWASESHRGGAISTLGMPPPATTPIHLPPVSRMLRQQLQNYNPTHTQRLAIIISGHNDANGNALTNNTVGFLDFVVPAAGASAVPLDSQRQIVTADACKQCHSPLFQKAHHADSYLDTRTCVICHSPLGVYSTIMQRDDAYLPVLVHQIHDSIVGSRFDWSGVTFSPGCEELRRLPHQQRTQPGGRR